MRRIVENQKRGDEKENDDYEWCFDKMVPRIVIFALLLSAIPLTLAFVKGCQPDRPNHSVPSQRAAEIVT